jgi:hypothetical protein
MIENPMDKISFRCNGGGMVVGLGKIAISINHSIFDVYLVEFFGLQFVVCITTL